MKNKFIQEAKQGRFGDNIVIANKEKAKRLKTLHANTPEIVEMINALEKAGDKGLDSIQIADALIQNISKLQSKRADSYVTVLRPKINSLIKSGIITKGGYNPDLPSNKKVTLSNLDDYLKNLEDNL
tara:strand:+ start:147 stop:527 length:381 start_codon:yes stop_codon:yes gene_type:complete